MRKDQPAVIAVATLKGGSGKSTVASCLAVHWHQQGRSTALVDADPQQSLVRLAQREKALGGVPVHAAAAGDEDLRAAVGRAAAQHALVLVDTPGFRAPATLAALGIANLVLVPVKPSPLDVDVMVDTARTLFRTQEGRAPPFACVLTQTTAGSVIARHIRNELAEAGFPLLASELVNRVAYGEAALYGATPTLMDPQGAAASEVAALAREIDARLQGGRT